MAGAALVLLKDCGGLPVRKWLPLTAACMGAFMLLVDITIVTVALPDMAAGLHTTFADLQWVMDGYALALATLLLSAGSLADRIGRRTMYLGGLAVFSAASLGCALADSPVLLIVFRVLQGAGGAAMFATMMALLSSTYRGRDRGVAFGVWGAVNGAAAAAGPVLGGLLTQHLGWRWIFYVNLPLAAVTLLVTLRTVKESRGPRGRVDLPGMASFTLAAGSTTFALIRAGGTGWTNPATLGMLSIGALAAVAFIRIEARAAHPMLDLSLFRDRSFAGIMTGGALMPIAAYSYLAYSSLWLQSARGLGPLATGLALAPMSAATFLVSGLAGRLVHRLPPRLPIGAGLLLTGTGALLQTQVHAESTWTALLPGLSMTGIGVGLSTPVLASAAMARVPQERAGMAGGALSTGRQLGNALGIAGLGLIFQAAHPAATSQPLLTPGRAAAGADAAAAVSGGLRDVLLVAGTVGLLAGIIVLLMVRAPAPSEQADAPRTAIPTRI
ncbi:MFS transporter [Streptomyces sp. NBC_00233]|uniref:MFS transporter n=1 Tax=Streptomyces sp. NBC_00233 TaxID=2975686 RepID=UPI002253E3CC|nr:MFS transporter [Streptomyces sp. NBC_00233]MCX5233556.1 MFS transporter [Streptomyces sp. NBC_00233]